MSASNNISPEIKDKLVEQLNEMLSAENAAVDRLDSRIQEFLLHISDRNQPDGRKNKRESVSKYGR